MRTEAPGRGWWIVCAALVAAQILALGALPFEMAEPWDSFWHVLAYAALALLLSIAADGRWPFAVLGAAGSVAALDAVRQAAMPGRTGELADFAVAFLAAAATVAALALARRGNTGTRQGMQTRGGKAPCAESSER